MIEISVVIPARNREKTIASCLESVLDQSYSVKEVIVVDDGSTDETVRVAEQFKQQGVNVIQLTHAHGAQYARNVGINAAKYPWIAFNDSDDIWLEGKLLKQVERLQQIPENQSVVVYGDYEQWNPEIGERKKIKIRKLNGGVFDLLLEHPGPTYQSMLVSKSLLTKIGELDEAIPSYQEWDTALRLAREGEFIHIPESLFLWRIGHSDAISSSKSRDILGYQYILDKYRADMSVRVYYKQQLNCMLRALRWGLFDQALDIMNQKKLQQGVFKMLRIFACYKVIPPAPVRFLCRVIDNILAVLK